PALPLAAPLIRLLPSSFFFIRAPTSVLYPLSLHDALPISTSGGCRSVHRQRFEGQFGPRSSPEGPGPDPLPRRRFVRAAPAPAGPVARPARRRRQSVRA